jgi:beta-N-acetylhexosaminidase
MSVVSRSAAAAASTCGRGSWRARRGSALLAALALMLAGLGGADPGALGTTGPGPSECVATTLGRLTLAQKVGQLFMVGIGGTLSGGERSTIQAWHLGSVTFSALVSGGRSAVGATTAAVQALATDATTGGVGFLVGANQEGGYVQALSGSGFDEIPTALTQGTLDPATLRTRAKRWGTQLRKAGVNVDLAPVADVVPTSWVSRNAPIGRLHRELGHAPSTVRAHVLAFLAGMRDAGELTTVKHFPGLGRVVGNTDFTSGVRDTLTTRDDAFLVPFRKAVAAGVPFVMVSLAEYTRLDPGTIAAFSAPIVTGILRGDLGFTGVVMSDSLTAAAVAGVSAGDRAVRFLRAGGDMIVVTSLIDASAMAARLLNRADAKPAFATRVDESVQRILRAKDAAGLLPCSG